MMEWMRRKMKAFLWFLVIAFIATIFYLWGAGGHLGEDERGVIVKVQGATITHRDLEASVRRLQEQYKHADPQQLRQYAFQQLVQRKLLLNAAAKMKTEVSPELLKQRVKSYFTSDLQLRQALNSPNVPWSALEEDARLVATLEKTEERVRSGARVTDAELRQAYLEDKEERAVKWLAVDIHPSPEEEQKVLNRLSDIQAKLQRGEDFAQLARLYSEDAGSKEQGGDLGWVVKGHITLPEIEKAIFSLKPQQVSAPVKTKYGYHLIKVEDVKKEEVTGQDGKKETRHTAHARHLLLILRAGPETRQAVRQKAESIHQSLALNASFEEATKTASASGMEPHVTRETSKLGKYENAAAAVAQAFAVKVGEASRPIETEQAFFIVQPISKKEPPLEDFERLKSTYVNKVLARKGDELYRMWLYHLYQKSQIQILDQKI